MRHALELDALSAEPTLHAHHAEPRWLRRKRIHLPLRALQWERVSAVRTAFPAALLRTQHGLLSSACRLPLTARPLAVVSRPSESAGHGNVLLTPVKKPQWVF